MPQPPYLPDFHPADFFLFPGLKSTMTGKCFASMEEIKKNFKQELLAIPKNAFQKYFEDWNKCWHKCIISEEGCFEGDKIVID